jgi:uncharacterized repeat protein (TIGR02543 family)
MGIKALQLLHFATYTLTTSASPTAGGTVTSGGVYNYGTNVSITASPAANYRFSGWSGSATGTANPLSVTMDSNKNITASFIRQYTLTASANPSAGGSVSGGGAYDSGSTATLTAPANSGYVFTGWSAPRERQTAVREHERG